MIILLMNDLSIHEKQSSYFVSSMVVYPQYYYFAPKHIQNLIYEYNYLVWWIKGQLFYFNNKYYSSSICLIINISIHLKRYDKFTHDKHTLEFKFQTNTTSHFIKEVHVSLWKCSHKAHDQKWKVQSRGHDPWFYSQ